ncbi:MAG TPA: glycosyltransferase family 1 protein [Myxococcales bacterium]|nr:glycosyltransferase family 1 protein [Myxococcales bacterium]
MGINAAPLAAARTGVGRYIAGLLDALGAVGGVRARPLFLPGPAARGLRGAVKRLPFAYALAEAARAAALLRERPTVYHETNHAAPFFRGPVVLTVHDLATVLHPESQEPARARHFARALLARARDAARVIVPTQAIAREVVAYLSVPASRVRAIHHGIEPRFSPGTERRQGFVLYVGDAGPRKGLSLLRAAIPRGVELKLAGPGHGYVSEDELLRLYRTAAVVALPSLYEGFGFPLVEAMACGTPCIASDDPALVEVSGGAALHVPRGDADALRAQLDRVLADAALREELSRKGVMRAAAFQWDECARRHAEAYLEAAG